MMNRTLAWVLLVCVAIGLGISLLGNLILGFIAFYPSSESKKFFREEYVMGKEHLNKKIAIIDLRGGIGFSDSGIVGTSMVDDLVLQLRQAEDDSDVVAIVIQMDSPGGEVTASDVLFHEISRVNQGKPVITYMNSTAASGAYYAAMGSRYIIANELCITASIGVIMQVINYERLSDFIGLKTFTFKSGAMKDLLNPSRTPTEEEKSYVQGLINEAYDKFVKIVATGRKLDETKLRQGVADGRIVSGKTALSLGLVDANGYLEDAVRQACKIAKVDEQTPAFRYVAPFRLGSLFDLFGKATVQPAKVQLEIIPENMELKAGNLYYISPHLFAR